MRTESPTRPSLIPRLPEELPWGLRSLALARSVETALSDSGCFGDAVDRLSAAVAELDARSVVGASEGGRRLAQAVASALELPVWSPGQGKAGRLVVIDAVINTGVGVAAWIAAARDDGLTDVVAIGLVAQRSALAQREAAGDRVLGLELV